MGVLYFNFELFVVSHLFCRVPSADSVRAEHAGTVNRATSYSAGAECTASADHKELNVFSAGCHQQAWTSASYLSSSGDSTFPTGKPPLPPLSRASNFSDTSQQHVLSKKEEDLSEEWLVDLT